ncbi:MAG TPA: radical SAM protein [Candidatus Cloacimonadota bacterium]|nr:radical SAM protein [Candidatus Cloacimonadota bacterium]HQL15273.1 radical SAM protein [Candidatus Cloacimonadota bacterium]
MKVTDIFFSLQGESTFAGLPCIFIRLSRCNLRCSYCDTKESWTDGIDMTIEQILDAVNQFPCQLVELTGGEPLLQSDAVKLMNLLSNKGYTVLLETNGSLPLQTLPSSVHIICDVKLPGSGHPDSFLISNLQRLNPHYDELKFVVSNKSDFDFAVRFIKTNRLQDFTLLFSPVYNSLDASLLAEWILASGLPLRLNLQLHKLIGLP